MKTIKLLVIPFFCLALFTSCDDDDDNNPLPVNEEEVITTMTVELTPTTGNTITLRTRDLDGDGPDAPVITVSGNLMANTTYSGSIELLDETDLTDVEDITEEVEEEDDEHQFFFNTDLGLVSYADMDDDGNPVGLNFTLTTGAAVTGVFTVTLRHELDKDAAGVSDGVITNAGGSTDITQTFMVTVM